MALDKVLKVYDDNGNEIDYDILASDVKFLPDGKDLPTKLAELEDEIGQGGYAPPEGGIPKSDLAQSVQDSLDKADSALQDEDVAEVAKTGDYNDLEHKPTIPDTSGLATKTELATKQDKISAGNGIVIANDGKTVSVAESIRTGAGKGATAVQGVRIGNGNINYPNNGVVELPESEVGDIPTKTSDLEKDDVYTKNQTDAAIAQALLGGVTGVNAPFTLVKAGDTWMLADNSPRLTISTATLTMRGATKTATFTVSGTKLQSDLSVSVENSKANWSVSPATIQAVNGVVNETTVTVTFSGTDSDNANILISTTGTSASVAVTYAAAPTLALSTNSVTLNSASGTAASGTVQLTGANLDASSIAIAISGSGFAVSPNTVTPSNGAVNQTLTITRAADASASSATLTITDTTDDITINASVEWIATESDNVGDVVTRKIGYSSSSATTPTIGIKFKITKKVGVSDATTNEVKLMNADGTTGYKNGNYSGLHHLTIPLVVTINGTDYKVTELAGGSLAYCTSLVYVNFELDNNNKTNVKRLLSDNNVSPFTSSSNFKGTDGNGTLELPDGVTTIQVQLVQSTKISKLVLADSVSAWQNLINFNYKNETLQTLDVGAGIGWMFRWYNYNALTKVIFRKEAVMSVDNPDELPGGSRSTNANLYTDIYVPDSQLASYQSNSTWSTAVNNGHVTLHSINELT